MQQPNSAARLGRLSRRELLRSLALGGGGLVGAYLLACRDGGPSGAGTPAAPTPVRLVTLESELMQWQLLSPSGARPSGRHDHALASDGQTLFLFGGRNASGSLQDLWTYDISGQTWTEVQTFGPQPRFGHNAVWDSGRSLLVVFGGQNGSTFYNDVWEFDPARTLWTQVTFGGPAPDARYGAGAAFDSAGHLLITHGFTSQGRFDDTWQYDLAAHTWTDVSPSGRRPVLRCLMRGVWDSLKQRMLIFGGQTNDTPFLEDLWGYSPEFSAWQELARIPHPPARTFYSMVFHDQGAQIILFGGNTPDGPVGDLWSFHSSGENWTEIPTAGGVSPAARYGHDAVIASALPVVFVFGGTDGEQEFDELWQLSPAP